jgi:hypothetical protein
MAGESADEVARAAREKAERLLRRSEAYAKGAAGERASAAVLATLPEPWVVLHDLRWPGRQRANVDHVAIGPTGVYVIDSKNWAGRITVAGGALRQNGYSRSWALTSAVEAAAAVAGLVPSLPAEYFRPVLCLTRDEELGESVAGVRVCTTSTLVSALTDGPAVLSQEWLDFLRFELDMSTRAAGDPVDHEAPYVPRPRSEAAPPLDTTPSRTRRPGRPTRVRRGRRTSLADLVAGLVASLVGFAVLAGVGLHFSHGVEQHQPARKHSVITPPKHTHHRSKRAG